MLIRPDGYIGLISDAGDLSAVSRYLTAIRHPLPQPHDSAAFGPGRDGWSRSNPKRKASRPAP